MYFYSHSAVVHVTQFPALFLCHGLRLSKQWAPELPPLSSIVCFYFGTLVTQYLIRPYSSADWEAFWESGLSDICPLQQIMYTIILKIVSVNHHLLLCQPPELQDPNCCFCCLHPICPSPPTPAPLWTLWHRIFPAGGREERQQCGDHRRRGGNGGGGERQCLTGGELTWNVKMCVGGRQGGGEGIVFNAS